MDKCFIFLRGRCWNFKIQGSDLWASFAYIQNIYTYRIIIIYTYRINIYTYRIIIIIYIHIE